MPTMQHPVMPCKSAEWRRSHTREEVTRMNGNGRKRKTGILWMED